MEHFALRLPQVEGNRRVNTVKQVARRGVKSPIYATAWEDGVVFTRLLCCWDDERDHSDCKRADCPFRHASQLAAGHPGGGQDFFELIPCACAGFSGGCKYHKNRLQTKKWIVPQFALCDGRETRHIHIWKVGNMNPCMTASNSHSNRARS